MKRPLRSEKNERSGRLGRANLQRMSSDSRRRAPVGTRSVTGFPPKKGWSALKARNSPRVSALDASGFAIAACRPTCCPQSECSNANNALSSPITILRASPIFQCYPRSCWQVSDRFIYKCLHRPNGKRIHFCGNPTCFSTNQTNARHGFFRCRSEPASGLVAI